MGHCAECHSPRNYLGAIDSEMRFAGTRSGPGGWPRGDVAYFLQTGAMPDGDYAGGEMAEVIDEGLSRLDRSDLEAMAEYLRSLPPVTHRIERPEESLHEEMQEKDPWE